KPSNGLAGYAVDFAGKTMIIDSSSIDGNNAGGLAIGGVSAKSTAFITNTTISNNSTAGNPSSSGCGIRINDASVVLNHATIDDKPCIGTVGNGHQPTQGGGLYLDFPAKVAMSNTVIANNTVVGSMPGGPDCFTNAKGLKSKGFNLIKDISDCTINHVA